MASSRFSPFVVLLLSTTMPGKAMETTPSSNPLAALDEGSLSSFLERPLFEVSRRRPIVAPLLPPSAPPPPVIVEKPPSLRLLGLVEGAHTAMAVVHRDDTGKTETLRSGDRVGAWIVEVLPAALRVTNNGRVIDFALFQSQKP